MRKLNAMRFLPQGMTHVPFEMTLVYWRHWMPFTNCYILKHAWLISKDIQGMCAYLYACFSRVQMNRISISMCMYSGSMHAWICCVNVYEFLPRGWGFSTLDCMCWQKKSRYTTGCIMKLERQQGDWYGYQSLPLCLCAFVWWPSKTSIAILASHRIGLLYKNTPASILQDQSGAEGVGVAGGGRGGCTKYSSEISLLDPTFWVHFIP